MPKIIQNKDGGKILFDSDDWVNGLLPNYGSSTSGNQKGVNQLSAMRSINPFRAYGYAYPGYLSTDVTNVSEVSEFCRKGLVNGSNTFIVTNGAKLQKLDLSNDTLSVGFHSITAHGGHATPVGNDCAIYTAKVGGASASQFFYSWSDNTDWDVGVFNLDATFDDDFMSTAPATPLASPYLTGGVGKPHPLILGDDDILYIGDRNFVHAYDGQNSADADGKFFPAVLTLPAGYIITSFAKTLYGLMIFTYLENSVTVGSSFFYQGDARAWEWDYNALDITRSYNLNDNYTTEGFVYKSTVGCFTQGRPTDPSQGTKLSKIQLLQGGEFGIVEGSAFIGNPPIRGGVEIDGDAIYFNSDGKIYSFGSPLVGKKSGLNQLTESLGSTSGMFGTFNSTTQYASSGATTSGGLQKLSTGYFATALFSTSLAEPVFPLYKIGRVKNVKVRYADITTNANSRALTLQLRDRSQTVSTIVSSKTDIPNAQAMVADFNTDSSGNPLLNFDALKLVVQYGTGNGTTDAPGISSIEVEYENINI